MKIKLLKISIITIFMVLMTTKVFSATGTVEAKLSSNKVKKGETFTITISAQSEDGINGIDTKYSYDSEKLELISAQLVDSNNWSNLGANLDITVISNSQESIKSADIYVLTFKVKDNASVGDILKVQTTDILLDTDSQTDSEVIVSAKTIEVEVIGDTNEEPTTPEDDKPENTPEQPTEAKPTEGEANDQGDKEKELQKEANENKEIQTKSVADLTAAKANLPKTGENKIKILALAIVVSILTIIFWKKYMKYNI